MNIGFNAYVVFDSQFGISVDSATVCLHEEAEVYGNRENIRTTALLRWDANEEAGRQYSHQLLALVIVRSGYKTECKELGSEVNNMMDLRKRTFASLSIR